MSRITEGIENRIVYTSVCVCGGGFLRYGHIIHGSKRKNLRKVRKDISNPSGQPSGSYWPESGRRSEKTTKNGLFFKVFGLFDTLCDVVST